MPDSDGSAAGGLSYGSEPDWIENTHRDLSTLMSEDDVIHAENEHPYLQAAQAAQAAHAAPSRRRPTLPGETVDVSSNSAVPLNTKAPDVERRTLMDPDARFRLHPIISGRYEVKELIATGGMGRVYLAKQLALDRLVAMKILLPQPGDKEFRKRFLLEASVSARLTHRHIVTVHDYGESEDGDLYLAMEYLDGTPLSTSISQVLRMSPERTCNIAMQICRALKAAHTKGVVHRDLKPRNVMLLRDDDEEEEEAKDFVKVLDFGLVKVFQPAETDSEFVDFTRVGTLLGSPKYMAPEQIRSQPIGPWTDVYALGAMMFHMLAGRPPFVASSGPMIMSQHLREPVPSIDSVAGQGGSTAPELEVILRKALEKNPSDRYPTMDELLADLKAAHRLITSAKRDALAMLSGEFATFSSESASALLNDERLIDALEVRGDMPASQGFDEGATNVLGPEKVPLPKANSNPEEKRVLPDPPRSTAATQSRPGPPWLPSFPAFPSMGWLAYVLIGFAISFMLLTGFMIGRAFASSTSTSTSTPTSTSTTGAATATSRADSEAQTSR